MAASYMDIIKQFVNGQINLKQLSDFIDERLFDLRQDPDSMTKEQSILSDIELLICEISDGFRNMVELEEYVKTLFIPKPVEVFENHADNKSLTLTTSSNRDATIILPPPVMPAPAIDYRLREAIV